MRTEYEFEVPLDALAFMTRGPFGDGAAVYANIIGEMRDWLDGLYSVDDRAWTLRPVFICHDRGREAALLLTGAKIVFTDAAKAALYRLRWEG